MQRVGSDAGEGAQLVVLMVGNNSDKGNNKGEEVVVINLQDNPGQPNCFLSGARREEGDK